MSLDAGMFLSGIYMATFAASGFFFLKFWRRTRDQFFLLFAWACWLIAAERVALLLAVPEDEPRSVVYFIRLAAFILIIAAIVNKNLQRK
ncbi:DUF5985 family protein [Oligoflexus tunisiensis]|uniref:DUF5985 family protein n=1 Tax=Oligoflexus tunisiensis TaxID=708132 RepID=UPI000B160115|nr:DUF5985 family protein [Oligoflexus tunisiensis]